MKNDFYYYLLSNEDVNKNHTVIWVLLTVTLILVLITIGMFIHILKSVKNK